MAITAIQHKRSNVSDKKPSVGTLLPGELAINYHKGSEAIYIENDNEEVVSINGTPDWNDILGKPEMFTPQLNNHNVLSPEKILITNETRDKIAGHIDYNSDGLMEFSTAHNDSYFNMGASEQGKGFRFTLTNDDTVAKTTVMTIKDRELSFGEKINNVDVNKVISLKPDSIHLNTYNINGSDGSGGGSITINKGIYMYTNADTDNVEINSGKFIWKSINGSSQGIFTLDGGSENPKLTMLIRDIDIHSTYQTKLSCGSEAQLKVESGKVTMRANSESQFRCEDKQSVFVGEDMKLIFKETDETSGEKQDKTVYLKNFIEQLYYVNSNDEEYVDLGLPSGLLWAKYNVGDYGRNYLRCYFESWGERNRINDSSDGGWGGGKKSFDWSDYSLCDGSANSLTKYCTDSTYGVVDGKTVLEKEDDEACSYSGSWRMPSTKDFEELIKNCTTAWTTDYQSTTASGVIFTSKMNGNELFFPALGYMYDKNRVGEGTAGYYWTNSLDYNVNSNANSFYFGLDEGVCFDCMSRCYGYCVRPVIEPHFSSAIDGGFY